MNNKANIGKAEISPAFMCEDYHVIVLDGKDREKTIFIIEEISKEISKNGYKSFWSDYHKKRERELTQIEQDVWLPRLLQTIRELGIKGCIRKVSMRNIKSIGRMSVKYLLMKLVSTFVTNKRWKN